MKNLKNQKGITLVALVVTIIVLLILAGVALNLVAGGDGVLNKASNAAIENSRASAKEAFVLKMADWQSEYYNRIYVIKDLPTTTTMGAFIVSEHPGGSEKVGDYSYKVEVNTAATTEPKYKVTILNDTNKTLGDVNTTGDITGNLTSGGTLTWDN